MGVYPFGSVTLPRNRIVRVSRSTIAKMKGRSIVISTARGTPLSGIPNIVAAAASVPFSSTVMLARCRASPMYRPLSPVIPLKSAGVEGRVPPSSEDYEVLLDQFTGEGGRPHGRLSLPGSGGDAQPGVEGELPVGVDGRELPGFAFLPEVDANILCGSCLIADGGETLAVEPEHRFGCASRRPGFKREARRDVAPPAPRLRHPG